MQYDSSLRETGYDKGDRHSTFVKKSTWIKKATPKASGAEALDGCQRRRCYGWRPGSGLFFPDFAKITSNLTGIRGPRHRHYFA